MNAESKDNLDAVHLRRRILWLAVPTFVVLAVELIGGWRFGKDMYSERYAVHLGPFYPVVWLVLALAIVAPLLILEGFVTIFSKWKMLRTQRGWLTALLLVLTISLVASMFSCAWSCGGHPTWMGGYR
jgi:hypothetical protein